MNAAVWTQKLLLSKSCVQSAPDGTSAGKNAATLGDFLLATAVPRDALSAALERPSEAAFLSASEN